MKCARQRNNYPIRQFVPRLEPLECRWVPATATQMGSMVLVTGTPSSETLIITDAGTNETNAIQISGLAVPFLFSKEAVAANPADQNAALIQIKFDMAGGNDQVIYRLNNHVNLAAVLPGPAARQSGGRYIEANLGDGQDTFRFTGVQDNGLPIGFVDAYLVVIARGNAGSDRIGISFQGVVLNAQVFLIGAGMRDDDFVTVDATLDSGPRLYNSIFAPIQGNQAPEADNSSCWTEVYGGNGFDSLTLLVNRSSNILTTRQLLSGDVTDMALASLGTTLERIAPLNVQTV